MKLRLTSSKKYKFISAQQVGRVTPSAPFPQPDLRTICHESNSGAHGVTRPTVSRYIPFHSQSGLTLVEILVASALLLFITLGLTMMFNQTARAFRSGVKQVDVLEGGRAALNLMTRDVEQMGGSTGGSLTNVFVGLGSATAPIVFIPPGSDSTNTNFLQCFFFSSYQNGWQGLGYRVLNLNPANLNDTNIVVGSLYRFSTNSEDGYLLNAFHLPPQTQMQNSNLHRIVDGVVHLQMKTYDRGGFLINTVTNGSTMIVSNDVLYSVSPPNDVPKMVYFRNGGMPAFVEVELGVLEPQTLEQVKPMVLSGNVAAARQFIQDHSGNIHIFRQQIPIRPAR